jgi:hypothetical protein
VTPRRQQAQGLLILAANLLVLLLVRYWGENFSLDGQVKYHLSLVFPIWGTRRAKMCKTAWIHDS